MAQRVKGQEVAVIVMVDGELVARIDSISSCNIEFELDLLEEGYLGETSQRYDSIFNGVSIEIVGHMTSQEALLLADVIVARAQNRVGGATRVDIQATFIFPNGDVPSVNLPDVFFEGVPFDIGARDEYVEFTLSGKTSTYQIVT